jgi:type IV pilus assembly protein PilV
MAATPSARLHSVHRQGGVMLLEALIAILIFSIGILGIVGLQATAVQQSTDARYRSEAAQLAEQLIGQMWVGNRSVTNLETLYKSCTSTSCSGYQDWKTQVVAQLPGVSDAAGTLPVVDVVPDPASATSSIVTISVFWRAPTEPASSDAHRFDIQTQIPQ